MKRHRHGKHAALTVLLLLLVLVILACGVKILEVTVLKGNGSEDAPSASKTITRDGVDYFPRRDITVVLVMGIDETGPVEDSGSYYNPGAADVVMLLVLDDTAETCTVLALNRDTMLEMPVLGIGGRKAGTYYGQLALAHTYGSGLEDSCENVREAVSDLLYGIDIDYYVSMNLDAVALLNDAVGGVTVEVTEDFSQVDPTIGMGTVTLTGEQAIRFVQTRRDVGDQLNLSRMERQEQYVEGFTEALRQTREQEGTSWFTELYGEAAPYLVTDCSTAVISSLLDRCGDYQLVGTVTPQGENVLGEEYYEFYLDEEALDELILSLFYAPK